MAPDFPLVAFLAGPFVSAVVYVDARRGDFSPRERLLFAGGTGLVSFGGFFVPYRFSDAIGRVYLQNIKPSPVVSSPYEMAILYLTIGIAVSVVSILAYGLGSRYGSLDRE